MAEQLWFTVLSSLAMAGAWALLRRGDAPPAADGDAFVFRYPPGFGTLGWVVLVVGLAFVGSMAVAFTLETPTDWAAFAVLAAFFAGPGLLFVAAQRREWARLTAEGFEVQGLFASEPERVRWADVERVRFGRIWGALTFRTVDGRTVRLSGLFQGTEHLASVVARRLPERGGAEAARDLLAYRGASGGGVSKR